MSDSLKRLVGVFIALIVLVGFFNYRHALLLSNLNASVVIFFILIMAVFVWKLGPLLGKTFKGSDIDDDYDAKLDIKNIRTSSVFFKGKSKKISYKKLGIISLDFLFFILLLNLFGYYHLYTLGKQRKQNDKASSAVNSLGLLNHEISNNMLLLNLTSNDLQNAKYEDNLQNAISSFKANQEILRRNINDDYNLYANHSIILQRLYAQLAPLIDTIASSGLRSMAQVERPTQSDSKFLDTEIEKPKKQFLSLLQIILEQYQKQEKNIDRDYLITNTVLFISLVVALILITWLVLMPILRSGSKTHSQLQNLLKETKKSEAMLRTIIDSTPDLIFVKNKLHKYQIVNQAFADQSNKSIQDFIDRTDIEMGLLPEDAVYGNPAKGIRGFWEDDEEVMASGVTKTSHELHVELSDWDKVVTTVKVPLKDESGKVWGILSFVHDITELKRTENELRSIHKLLEAVAKATYELISSNNLDEAMGKSATLLGNNLRVDMVNIYKRVTIEGSGYIRQLVNWNGSENAIMYNQPGFQFVPEAVMGMPLEILSKNETFCSAIEDLHDSRIEEWANKNSVKSVAAFSIFVLNEFWGFVSFNDCKTKRNWEEFELSIIKAFAGTLGAVIERRETERQLTIARDEAELANKVKGEFMANMSHELRTPMNGILGFNQLLLASPLKNDQRGYAMNISKSANNLLHIINDILDLSQIQEGRLVLEKSVFSLSDLVREIVDSMTIKALDKKLELKYGIDSNLPALLEGDAARIRQILYNLVSNAIKFTEKGKVWIEIKKIGEVYFKESKKHIDISIIVDDTGIGIRPRELNKIFESFTQADSSATRKYGGNGLGLAISRNLAELMGGKLGVTSKLGKGSTFDFQLSLEVIQETNEVAKVTEISPIKAMQETYYSDLVLVVEDDGMNLTLISEVLRKMEIKVISAMNGKEALDRVLSYNPGLIFMDVNMPVMDGITSTRLIRKMPEPYCNIPIVALSADTMKDDVENCIKAGMNSFISKPFKIKEITDALKNYVQSAKT